MTTIYETIVQDHEELRNLMKKMTSARSSVDERHKAFKQFSIELAAHSGAEERFLYSPVLMHDEGLDKTRHSMGEHDEAEEMIEKMKSLNPKGKAFSDKAKELTKAVRHHMEEEEGEYFRVSRKVLTPLEGKRLQKQFEADHKRLKKKFERTKK
jgi:hypothetical protein